MAYGAGKTLAKTLQAKTKTSKTTAPGESRGFFVSIIKNNNRIIINNLIIIISLLAGGAGLALFGL